MYYFKQTENRKETKSCTHVCGWKCVHYLSGVHSFLFYFNLVNEEREEKEVVFVVLSRAVRPFVL